MSDDDPLTSMCLLSPKLSDLVPHMGHARVNLFQKSTLFLIGLLFLNGYKGEKFPVFW